MGVVATVFMGVSSLALAVAFHAMRGMYLHAERLLAKAGRQGAMRRGIAHAKRSDFSQKNYGETSCAAPGQRPQRGLASLFVCGSTPHFRGGVAGRTRGCYELLKPIWGGLTSFPDSRLSAWSPPRGELPFQVSNPSSESWRYGPVNTGEDAQPRDRASSSCQRGRFPRRSAPPFMPAANNIAVRSATTTADCYFSDNVRSIESNSASAISDDEPP